MHMLKDHAEWIIQPTMDLLTTRASFKQENKGITIEMDCFRGDYNLNHYHKILMYTSSKDP